VVELAEREHREGEYIQNYEDADLRL